MQFRSSKMNFYIIWTISQFYNTQSKQISSLFGLLTSLMICALGFYFFLTEVVSMISQSKPAIYQIELSISETEPILLQNDNFTLAISKANRYSEPLIGIDRYFNLNITQCERFRELNKDSGKISVNLRMYIITHRTMQYVALYKLTIKGVFFFYQNGRDLSINREYLKNNPLVKKLRLLRYCKVRLHPIHSDIYLFSLLLVKIQVLLRVVHRKRKQKILELSHYNVYKSDYLTKLDQPGYPYEEIITNEFTTFSLSTSKTISQKYKILQTSTDEGLIWEQIQSQSNIQQSEWREISEFYNNQYLIVHYIRLDYKQTNNIERKLGGIFQILIMIVAIILRPIIENFMKLEMVNNLFNFSEPFSDTKLQINKTNNQQSIQQFTKRNQNMKLSKSNLETWLIIFGCRQFKKKQFVFAKNKVNKNLEIVNILRKLQEVKVIKKTLLSKEQQIVLKNYLKIEQDHSMISQKSNLALNQYGILIPERLFQKDHFNSSQVQEINSQNECDIQEVIPQKLKF